jgi:SAM-dependent methyltransferase
MKTLRGSTLSRAYRTARMLVSFAYWRFVADPARVNDRAHRRGEWNFEAPAERERYARVLDAVMRIRPRERWGAVLEVGCSEGTFTEELAKRAVSVTACDVSPLACSRARERCARYPHVTIERVNLVTGPIHGSYDVVFAMGVLDFVQGRARKRAAVSKLARALVPGGLLVVTVTRLPPDLRSGWWARRLLEGGDMVPTLLESFALRQAHFEEFPEPGRALPGSCDHVIGVFEKATGVAEETYPRRW